MSAKLLSRDPRIDPRIKAVFGSRPTWHEKPIEERREDLVPSTGLDVSTEEFASQPDGNMIKMLFIRPSDEHSEPVATESDSKGTPCVYFMHGGGMVRVRNAIRMHSAYAA